MNGNTLLLLKDIWRIENLNEYKAHFARYDKNTDKHPLQVWVTNRKEWVEWQEYWPGKDDFNRRYIFSFMDFYHETDTWLFGGVFEVNGIVGQNDSRRYNVKLTEQGAPFIGRLKLSSTYRNRATRVNFENHYCDLIVDEVFQEQYTGQSFSGYEDINHSFFELVHIWTIQKPDWKAALKNLKGVYLITDMSNGKNYVGSAHGDFRIWGRWSDYFLGDGHGGNAGLRNLLLENGGKAYAERNFRFSLLEYWAREVPDDLILRRESHWKDVLQSRQHGYNEN